MDTHRDLRNTSILKITWRYSKKSCVYKIMRTKCGTSWSPISRLKNLNKTNFCSLSPQSVLFCYKTSNEIIPEIILISFDKQNKILCNFEMQPTLIISMDFYSLLKESIPKSSISTLCHFAPQYRMCSMIYKCSDFLKVTEWCICQYYVQPPKKILGQDLIIKHINVSLTKQEYEHWRLN